jgi:hypothetical protein
MWVAMVSKLDGYSLADNSFPELVSDVRGLFEAADPHDGAIRSAFQSLWSELDMELELRTEPWAPAGSTSDARLLAGIASLRRWVVEVVLTDDSSEHN